MSRTIRRGPGTGGQRSSSAPDRAHSSQSSHLEPKPAREPLRRRERLKRKPRAAHEAAAKLRAMITTHGMTPEQMTPVLELIDGLKDFRKAIDKIEAAIPSLLQLNGFADVLEGSFGELSASLAGKSGGR